MLCNPWLRILKVIAGTNQPGTLLPKGELGAERLQGGEDFRAFVSGDDASAEHWGAQPVCHVPAETAELAGRERIFLLVN